jgi:hypothetical protein
MKQISLNKLNVIARKKHHNVNCYIELLIIN